MKSMQCLDRNNSIGLFQQFLNFIFMLEYPSKILDSNSWFCCTNFITLRLFSDGVCLFSCVVFKKQQYRVSIG